MAFQRLGHTPSSHHVAFVDALRDKINFEWMLPHSKELKYVGEDFIVANEESSGTTFKWLESMHDNTVGNRYYLIILAVEANQVKLELYPTNEDGNEFGSDWPLFEQEYDLTFLSDPVADYLFIKLKNDLSALIFRVHAYEYFTLKIPETLLDFIPEKQQDELNDYQGEIAHEAQEQLVQLQDAINDLEVWPREDIASALADGDPVKLPIRYQTGRGDGVYWFLSGYTSGESDDASVTRNVLVYEVRKQFYNDNISKRRVENTPVGKTAKK